MPAVSKKYIEKYRCISLKLSDPNVLAVGHGGRTILHYDGNPEMTWNQMAEGSTDRNLYGIWGSSESDVYATSTNGLIIHYDGNPEGFWSLIDRGVRQELEGFGVHRPTIFSQLELMSNTDW